MEIKKISEFVTLEFETNSNDYSEWFGYYNYDTLNHDQTKMLCGRSKYEAVKPEKGMVIELGFYDLVSGVWHHIGESDSWNWPQGSMLQWIPGSGNENKVIFNCSKDNRIISRIHDISTGEDKDIDWPIYVLTPDGKKSIAINMERAYWCRTYHYQSVANKQYDVAIADDDGIYEIDLEKNSKKRIITIQDVISIDADESFKNAKHWLEHIMISPSGKRICFLHRFAYGDVYHYATRLCIANSDGSDLKVVEGWRKYRWSHFGWKGDDEFCIYTYPITKYDKPISIKNAISKANIKSIFEYLNRYLTNLLPRDLRLRIQKRYPGYQHYSIQNDSTIILKDFYKGGLFIIDGHPSFTNDQRYMVTDTYADPHKYRNLLIYDTLTKKTVLLAKLQEPLVGNPARCDFHPKLCRNNNYVVIDTTYTGKHRMILFKIDWESVKKALA